MARRPPTVVLLRHTAPTRSVPARRLAVAAPQDGGDRGQPGRAVLLDLVADLLAGLAAGGVPPADVRAFQGQPAADVAPRIRTVPRLPAPAASNRRPDATSASSTRSLCTVRPSASRAGPGVVAQPGAVQQQVAADPGFGEAEGPGLAFPLGAEVLVEPGPVPDRDEVGQQSRSRLVDQGRPAQRQLAGDGRPGQADRAQRSRAGRGQALMTALAGSGVAFDRQVLGHQRGHRGRRQLGVPEHQVARDRAAGQADRARPTGGGGAEGRPRPTAGRPRRAPRHRARRAQAGRDRPPGGRT